MNPGAVIAPHSGPVNTIINTHLGLRGVEGATFFVNGTEVQWREGETFSFEDSFEHWGNHASDAPLARVVLMIRQMHPDVRHEHYNGHKLSTLTQNTWISNL
jgi:aspartyl/asparaginyl beta-hydroxylase (cupin superfamily)